MSMKTIFEKVQVKKGSNKADGSSFFFVEVYEPVRKYINPEYPQDAATLDALATTGEAIELVVTPRGKGFVFSSSSLVQ